MNGSVCRVRFFVRAVLGEYRNRRRVPLLHVLSLLSRGNNDAELCLRLGPGLRLSCSSPFGRDPTASPAKATSRNPGQIPLGYYSRLFNPRNFHLARRRRLRESKALFLSLARAFRVSIFITFPVSTPASFSSRGEIRDER